MARPRGGSGTIDEITGQDGKPADAAPAAAQLPVQTKTPPALPTQKVKTGTKLEEKTILLYGPAGIGKSTLASEFGEIFFFDTAGELNEIEVYKESIPDWATFRNYCWALAENPGQFTGACIDTGDNLALYCSQRVRAKLGIVHESDSEYGKGWSLVNQEWATNLAKLIMLPNLGVITISHATEVEIKTRNAVYNMWQPTLAPKGIRQATIDSADLVLFIDWAEDEEEGRVIKTKPSRYWVAKERGEHPRLPEVISWPHGKSGYEVLKEAWEAGA